ncbi:MAG TPA: META domain-containing protein [Bacteroidia bacterium]|jgi:heat shock protein HslJ|nr:META domain-containing protein [Bacteroidia bacterium]
MKPLILILSLFFSLTAFGQHADSTNSLTGKWHLILFRDLKTGQMTDTASIQDRSIAFYNRVVLDFEGNADSGTIVGHSFCNSMVCNYRIYNNSKIAFDHYGSTLVNCLYEGKFMKALQQVSSYKRNKDTLNVLYNNDSEEMLFNAVK